MTVVGTESVESQSAYGKAQLIKHSYEVELMNKANAVGVGADLQQRGGA
jgi:hypothetical protein